MSRNIFQNLFLELTIVRSIYVSVKFVLTHFGLDNSHSYHLHPIILDLYFHKHDSPNLRTILRAEIMFFIAYGREFIWLEFSLKHRLNSKLINKIGITNLRGL